MDDKCVKPTPICPPNYELHETGLCVQTTKKCLNGTLLIDGKCQKTVIKCPEGYEKIADQCYKIIQLPTNPPSPLNPVTTDATPTKAPPNNAVTTESIIPETPIKKVCPDGFTFYKQQCYRCPDGFSLCNGKCRKNISPCQSYKHANMPNINIHVNIPILDILKSTTQLSNIKPVNIINHVEPINNTVHNYNNVTRPVTLNNVNENNIFVYTDTMCADGKVRTTIIKNNQTIVGCDENDSESETKGTTSDRPQDSSSHKYENEANKKDQKCCEIVTPRFFKNKLRFFFQT